MSTDELDKAKLVEYLTQPALRDTFDDTIESVLTPEMTRMLDGLAKLSISIAAHHGLLISHEAIHPVITTTVAVWTRILAADPDLIDCVVRAHNILNRQKEDVASKR